MRESERVKRVNRGQKRRNFGTKEEKEIFSSKQEEKC
jgi:hypothetical protein